MSKTFLKLSIALLAAAGTVVSSLAAMPGRVTLTGHVPAVVSQLTPLEAMAATNILHLTIGLPVHNQSALNTLLQQIYDPASTNYHHYLTPAQYTAQFGPTPADYQAVQDFATANGLTVTHTHANRMLVDVDASVTNVEQAFHVTMRKYHHPTEARDFYAPSSEPSVPANLPVLSVQGLNNYVLPQPMLKKMSASNATPANGSGLGGSYIGKDFRNAYLPGSTLNGSGQIVGLFQFDGYYANDIATYMSLAGYTNVPLENVLLDGFDGTPGPNNDEVCLDIETSIAMAPALAKVVVFEAGPYGNANDILSSMASRTEIKQFSASWGYATDATTEQLYQQMALQGQTFFNASGDGDAWVGPIPYGSCESPNITIVGGTTLTMNGQGVSYASEKVWNWGYAGGYNWNPDGYVGSSGGISTTIPIPTWQQGVSMANNHGSTTFRNVPDVALTGDNVFVVSSGGSEGAFGGTSCASPLWAGFMALVNQQAAINGRPSVGFLAPAVYTLAKTAGYTNYFHDTAMGDNTWDQSPTNFFGVPGYDLATGLGTPNGTNFINALTGATNVYTGPIISAPPGPWGTNLAALSGSNPNGFWFLFVQDDKPLDVGIISNGWFITLTTANPVGFAADNELITTPVSQSVIVGSPWSVTLTVTNYGPSVSSNVVVSDILPVGLTLVSSNASTGVLTSSSYAPQLVWNLGTLPVNAGGVLTLNFLTTTAGSYTNVASVAGATLDPNSDDDVASATLVANAIESPVLSAATITGNGGFQFAISGNPGASTLIQASTNLVNWVNLYTNVSPFTYTSLDATNFPQRFYRAVVATP